MKFLIILPLLLMPGCIKVFPEAELPAQVGLNIDAAPIHSNRRAVLEVVVPSTPLMYDTTRLRLKTTSETGLEQYSYIKGYAWTERLPKLLQRSLVESLRPDAGLYVFENGSTAHSDYKLKVDIQKFDFSNDAVVDVHLYATLLDAKTSKIITTQKFITTNQTDYKLSKMMESL